MREIAPEAWPRSEHFKTFGAFHYPHFNMCAEVDLTVFRAAVTQEGASLTTAIVYVIARAANDIPEFRQRIRGETVVEHDVVHPSTTILVDEDLFSFCALDYTEDFSAFTAHAAERVADVKKHPTLATRPERDDLLYMTAIPWVSFTSFAHPILSLPADSVPRFAWGKFHNDGDRVKECGTSPFVSQLADEAFWDGSETGPLLVTNRACPPQRLVSYGWVPTCHTFLRFGREPRSGSHRRSGPRACDGRPGAGRVGSGRFGSVLVGVSTEAGAETNGEPNVSVAGS